jgi:hypothetical protein
MDVLVHVTDEQSTSNWSFVQKVKGPMYSPFLRNIDISLGPYNQVLLCLIWEVFILELSNEN